MLMPLKYHHHTVVKLPCNAYQLINTEQQPPNLLQCFKHNIFIMFIFYSFMEIYGCNDYYYCCPLNIFRREVKHYLA